ncbi:MAG: VOC family protein [Roseovarius sp.]|nr:VOC family protein [Roseovarius sp.]MCY4292254.1 VOC family protein [Roseovarius sp.]
MLRLVKLKSNAVKIMRIKAIDHFVLTVTDMDKTMGFYRDVLGMKTERFTAADDTVRYALKFGRHKINLHQSGREFEPKARTPRPGSADLCFLSDIPLSEWQTHCSNHGVAIEIGPVRRTGATGPIMSIYMRDPDGNLIEISNQDTKA